MAPLPRRKTNFVAASTPATRGFHLRTAALGIMFEADSGAMLAKTALLILISLSVSVGHADVSMPGSVSGFQAWKKERTDAAQASLDKLQPPIDKSLPAPKDRKAANPATPVKNRTETKSQLQAQLNVEIAQELTVNDYFVLYLAQFKTREAFIEAAKKLTPEEMAELMMSYQKHLVGAQELEVSAPASVGAPSSTAAR